MTVIETKTPNRDGPIKCFMCEKELKFIERLNCRTIGHNCCSGCKAEAKSDLKRINELITADGHARHCAYRQVWGDGECECTPG